MSVYQVAAPTNVVGATHLEESSYGSPQATVLATATIMSLHQTVSRLTEASELIEVRERYKPGGKLNPSMPGGYKPDFLAAALHGDLDALSIFIKNGLDLNKPPIWMRQSSLLWEFLNSNLEYYDTQKGKNINLYPNYDSICLKTFRFLVEHGAKYLQYTNNGNENGAFRDAIQKFQKYGDNGVEAIRFALAHGIREKGVLAFASASPPYYNVEKGYQEKIVQLLIEFGCKLDG